MDCDAPVDEAACGRVGKLSHWIASGFARPKPVTPSTTMSGAFVMPGGIMADAWTETLALIMRANAQAEAEAALRQARHRAIERERERRDIEALMR